MTLTMTSIADLEAEVRDRGYVIEVSDADGAWCRVTIHRSGRDGYPVGTPPGPPIVGRVFTGRNQEPKVMPDRYRVALAEAVRSMLAWEDRS